jgi:hypothetical protein
LSPAGLPRSWRLAQSLGTGLAFRNKLAAGVIPTVTQEQAPDD